jgi:DNA-nicking Smr family endonuclease
LFVALQPRGAGSLPYGIDPLLDAKPSAFIDLHGMTGQQCRQILPNRLSSWRNMYAGKVVHIITGKGKGSIGEPVLKNLVRKLLRGTLSAYISDFTEDIDAGGYLVMLK